MNQPAPGQPQPVPVKGPRGATVAIIVAAGFFVIIAIVGILAAIAIPSFVKFQCRSKQSEAKTNLKSAYVAEEAFRAENNRYSTSFEDIGWQPYGERVRYDYSILKASEDELLLEARGVGDMEGDVWQLDQTNELVHFESRCN
jgi:type IV pilus assembly protein PilA